jgi:molecular chaperone GrpE
MTGAVDTATTRDAGIQPLVEAACEAAPTGRGPDAPTPSDDQTLQDQLSQARRQRDEYLDTLQRVQAEYDNYRRRARREQSEQHDRGGQALAEKLLPVLDSFDAARAHAPDVLAPLQSALHDALHAAGLERLEPTDEPFDPAEQHAVEQLPRQDEPPAAEDDAERASDPASVVVDAVLRPGYRWRGRLVRPAMVRVRTD